MDKVICVNCRNEVIYNFNLLNEYFTKIHNNITTDIIKDKMTTLKYFDIVIKCCDEPDYAHTGDKYV